MFEAQVEHSELDQKVLRAEVALLEAGVDHQSAVVLELELDEEGVLETRNALVVEIEEKHFEVVEVARREMVREDAEEDVADVDVVEVLLALVQPGHFPQIVFREIRVRKQAHAQEELELLAQIFGFFDSPREHRLVLPVDLAQAVPGPVNRVLVV